MESIRTSIRRLAATAALCAAVPAARAQDGADAAPPRALPAAAAYQHVPLIPRDLGSYAAKNQIPPPVSPRQPFGPAPTPAVTPAAPSNFRQSAWLSAPTAVAQQPAPTAEPGLLPKKDVAPAKPAAPAAPQQPTTYQSFPAMTAPSSAPSWRWHGYGAVAVTDVPQPYSAGAQPPAYTPSQPVKPADAKPAETKANDSPAGPLPAVAPLPAAANISTGANSEWVPPGGYAAPPPMPALPPAPPSTSPLSYLDPVWKSSGDPVAVNATNADPWPEAMRQAAQMPQVQQPVSQAGYTAPTYLPQQYQQQPQLPSAGSFGSAFYPANPVVAAGTPRVYTSRGVSDAPTYPPTSAAAVKQATFSSPQQQQQQSSAVARVRTPEPPLVPVRRVEPPKPADPLAQFKASIERVCAGKGYGVDLSAKGPGSLLLKLKVRRADDAEALASRIAQIPELGPYQIAYEIQVGQ